MTYTPFLPTLPPAHGSLNSSFRKPRICRTVAGQRQGWVAKATACPGKAGRGARAGKPDLLAQVSSTYRNTWRRWADEIVSRAGHVARRWSLRHNNGAWALDGRKSRTDRVPPPRLEQLSRGAARFRRE